MHEAGLAQPGTMAAVLGLDDDQVDVACRRADEDVWVANYNAPGQVVIAGSPEGVAAASAHAKELGAKKVMPLQVSGAFHTPFMTAARNRLRAAIAEADPRDTEVPVVSNVDALPHHEGKEWASLLSAQLSSPVRWKQCLQELEDLGVTDYAELGPGGVLTGMAKRTVTGARTISVATPEELDKLLEWVTDESTSGPVRLEGEHLFASERLVVSPAAGIFTPRRRDRRRARRSRSAPCSATSASTRSARRSPAPCRATSPSTPSGSPPASRSPGCARAEPAEGAPPCLPSDRAPVAPSSPAGAPPCRRRR